MIMKYDERACKFNMDTGCVELLLRDGRKISIDCTGVEDAAGCDHGAEVRTGHYKTHTRYFSICVEKRNKQMLCYETFCPFF